MDVKSLAKSKRAHSQHHNKKHHPNQKSKAPSTGSVGATSANKPPGKQIKEKAPQLQGSSALSSNWDRYEEESDVSLSQPTDVILPKSKGADYAYLISEAMAHSQTTSSSESFPSFDDVFTGWYFLLSDSLGHAGYVNYFIIFVSLFLLWCSINSC